MNCKEIEILLSKYLEDELDLESKNLVAQHLRSCKGCARELDALKSMVSSLGRLKKVEPPFDLLESIHQRLEKPSRARAALKQIFYPPYIKLPIEAVAVAVTILLVIHIVNFIPPKEVMIPVEPVLEEEKIDVAMKEERLAVIDYVARKEIAKELPISEIEPDVALLAVPQEELARTELIFAVRPQLPTITREIAIQLSNQFVVEQGYTDVKATLPTDTLYFDELEQIQQHMGASVEEVLEARYGSIENIPVIIYEDEMHWNFVYRVRKAPNFGQIVNVDKNTAKVRMVPKKVSLDYLMKSIER